MIFTPLNQRIFVRFARFARRKPIWMPTAKTKLFRIPEQTFYSPEEKEHIRELTQVFRAQEYAIRDFMKHEFYIPATQSGGLPQDFIESEEIRESEALKENDLINARLAEMRNKMFSDRLESLEIELLEKKQQMEQELEEIAADIDKYIQENKDDFVTPENIDETLERVVGKTVNYEFGINSKGNILKGQKKSTKEEQSAQT